MISDRRLFLFQPLFLFPSLSLPPSLFCTLYLFSLSLSFLLLYQHHLQPCISLNFLLSQYIPLLFSLFLCLYGDRLCGEPFLFQSMFPLFPSLPLSHVFLSPRTSPPFFCVVFPPVSTPTRFGATPGSLCECALKLVSMGVNGRILSVVSLSLESLLCCTAMLYTVTGAAESYSPTETSAHMLTVCERFSAQLWPVASCVKSTNKRR